MQKVTKLGGNIPARNNVWRKNRDELLAFWRSGEYTTSAIFPDSKPWLFDCGSPDPLPWAAEHLD
jgi:hypothetical protein